MLSIADVSAHHISTIWNLRIIDVKLTNGLCLNKLYYVSSCKAVACLPHIPHKRLKWRVYVSKHLIIYEKSYGLLYDSEESICHDIYKHSNYNTFLCIFSMGFRNRNVWIINDLFLYYLFAGVNHSWDWSETIMHSINYCHKMQYK